MGNEINKTVSFAPKDKKLHNFVSLKTSVAPTVDLVHAENVL